MSNLTFHHILGAANVDALEAAASEIAQKQMPLILELYRSNGYPLNFVEFVTVLLGRYGHWLYIEGQPNWKEDGVTLRHEYGLKWSKFLKVYLTSAYKTFSRDEITVTTADQFIRINFAS